jgi:hypothetical protein
MDLIHALPFVATAVTLTFAALVLNRYRLGRRKHSLLWGLGLLFYGLGTLAEAYLALGWSPLVLRLWYLFGAMLTAAWLGQGTVYLLMRRPGVADRLAAGLVVASLLAAGAVFTAPLDASAYVPGIPISSQYREILTRSAPMVVLTISLNIYGSVMLIGGALWSAWLFARKRVLPNRVMGNVLIAIGAMFPASAGALSRLGLADWLYASELAGAVLMFIGFWLATQPQPAEREARAAARA